MPSSEQGEQRLEEVLDNVIELGRSRESISVGDIQACIGPRSYGPFLFLPALVEISPVGGIPGVPTLLALLVSIFCVQMALGRQRFWIPHVLRDRSLHSDKLVKGLQKVRPLVRWLDRLVRPRLGWAARGAFVRLISLACLLLAGTVPPLELVPFASSAPFAAICLFGLGLTARDGLVVLLGLLASGGTVYLVLSMLTGS